MCTVSNLGDNFGDKYKHSDWYPYVPENPTPTNWVFTGITRKEFDELKHEVTELKKLLIAAKKFDEATGQPDCEMADKIAILKKVAEFVGVNLDEVFKPQK